MKTILTVWVIREISAVIVKGLKKRNTKTENVRYSKVMHPAEFALRRS